VSAPAKLLYWPEIHHVEYALGCVVGAYVCPHVNSGWSVPELIGKNVGFVGEPEQHGTSPGQMITAPVAGGSGGTVSVVVTWVIAFGYGTAT
jgi:hypothetical protein